MPDRLYFTESDEANALIASDPMALLLGFELDQRVTVMKAFQGPLALKERLGAIDADISIHLNGCPNACARTQVADIGLKGQLVMHEGQQVEGFQVHLGGATGLQANFGRKLRAHKVTSAGLDDYITTVVTNFLADRDADESFATWVARADEDLLRGDKALAATS